MFDELKKKNIKANYTSSTVIRLANTAFCVLGLYLILSWAFLPVIAQSENFSVESEKLTPFRVAFTRSMFSEVNTTDGQAAVKAWSQTIADDFEMSMEADAKILDSINEVNCAFRESKIDAITLLINEFAYIDKTLISGPYFRHAYKNSIFDQYIILVRNDSNIKELSDLSGLSVLLHDHSSTSMVLTWLETALHQEGLGNISTLFKDIKYEKKVSKVVLDIFFRKQDCGVVTVNSFNTMVELNPQVGKTLRILRSSEPIISSLFCFRKSLDSGSKEKIVKALKKLESTIGGKQVLRIFKGERMVVINEKEIRSSLKLIEDLDSLKSIKDGVIK